MTMNTLSRVQTQSQIKQSQIKQQESIVAPLPSAPFEPAINDSAAQRSGKFNTLVRGIMECLFDGTMLLTNDGELLYSNSDAARICQLLTTSTSNSTAPTETIPHSIWDSCKALIDSREVYPDRPVIIEDEIKTQELGTIRIRVRWFDADIKRLKNPCLLVTLEDQVKSAQYRALAEARKYRLTNRETDVWLLKREGYTYKEIASKLYISEDTVKKHIKNIHAKRDAIEWVEH